MVVVCAIGVVNYRKTRDEAGFLVSGIPYAQSVLLVAAITTVYTVLGGMYSNAYVGVLKAVLLLAGYVIAVPMLLHHLGGLHSIAVALHSIDPRLTGSWFSWRQL